MRVEAIEEALEMRPFQPFRFVLPSDRAVEVPHPEFASVAPNRKAILVWKKRGGWSLVDPALVVELAFNGSKKK
jgi:hypothetical protein